MIKQLEKQIRELQKELAEVQKEQAAFRLQPCRGDSEIRKKDGKLEEHGNTGRSPQNRIPDKTKKKVLALSCQKYTEFNDRPFGEQLTEEEGIILGRETVRKVRREAGILPKRKR